MTQKTKSKPKGENMPPIDKVSDQNELVPSQEYPLAAWAFENFNPVQSRVFDYYKEDANTLIAARTSSGKTVVAEMFLAHEIRKRGGKGMFLAPLRALAQEKIDQWTDLQYHFKDLKISICTGDYRLTKERSKELSEADMIIMTSEMLNHRSRNFKSEQNNWLLDVGTLVVDECLPPSALIDTDKGLISIGEIIDQNLDVKVASFNHNSGLVEYKKIVARQKKLLKRRWRTIYYEGGNISVTHNHLVWCEGRGYVPSKNIKFGDILYVRRTNSKRETGDFGYVARRRINLSATPRKIGEIKDSTIVCPKGFCRVEVQRVEETGWHAAQNKAKRRLRQRGLPIQYSFDRRDIENSCFMLPKWEEDGELSLARRDQRSDCVGSMVHGRWESRFKSNVNTHRRIFSNGSEDVVGLASKKVESAIQSIFDEKILANSILSGGERQISKFNSTFCDSKYGVQSVAEDGANILFNVWSEISCESSRYSYATSCYFVQEQGMSSQMGQNVRTNEDLDSEESWCCDLEIEDHNNFFADGVLVHNCHLLTVPGRGDHLEVGLMKFTEINPKARIVLLSATMPNVDQIAEWVSYSLTKKQTYVLNSEYRPVPLNIHYEIYDDSPRRYDQIEKNKVGKALEIIGDWYSDDKFLVFAHTKRTGEMMKTSLRGAGIKAEFHNADLDKESRVNLERSFRTDPKLRVIVATPTLAWGLNLPARRVIILGVHRGIQEVETYNITQMVGRSGRLGIDPAGDAYILVPESQEELWRKKLQKPQKIESQLLEREGEHHKVLAFHLVSEIHHGYIKTNDDVHRWYERSLAYFQDKNLHERVVDDTLELLKDKGCLKFEDDTWKITSVGMIASMFYFSPFDVADLRNNFWRLFANNQQDNDYFLAMALANTDTNRSNIVSRAEKEEMSLFANRVRNLSGVNYTYPDPVIKAGYCYFNLLSGNNSANLAAIQRNFQFDYPRLSQVLLALDSMSGKWEQSGYLYTLEDRIRNGVPAYLVNLCRIPNIGKVRAKKLFDYGIKSAEEFADVSEEKLRKLLNLKQDVIKAMLDEANKLSLTSA